MQNNSANIDGNRSDSGSIPSDFISDEKEREELKREKMFDPVQRWKAIQEMIAWAEQNMPPQLRRNRPRMHPANQNDKAS
jgi:hypothetical protein